MIKPLSLIHAPSNLGLRPLRPGHVPGAWRAPSALEDLGLHQRLQPARTTRLQRPDYAFAASGGAQIAHAHQIRRFNEELALAVDGSLSSETFPLVLGGDCSILLGCLLGTRRAGEAGLIHIDGHSDFTHAGNEDLEHRIGSAAGMDLALATGRGEPILADWFGSALLADEQVVQIGERDELDADYPYGEIGRTAMTQIFARKALSRGMAWTARTALSVPTLPRSLWLHVDLDVLSSVAMPAVDSPGEPGLTFEQLTELLRLLIASGRVIGADVTIYDPDLDPDARYGRRILDLLELVFAA